MTPGHVHWGRVGLPGTGDTRHRGETPDARNPADERPQARRPAAGDAAPDAVLLRRLTALGLRPVTRLRLTRNRSVMVSLSREGVLSIHQAYAAAPDRVLRAVVRFVARGTRREMRKAAEHEILGFASAIPEEARGERRRRERALPEDAAALERLGLLFTALNQRHFGGALPAVPVRLSGRMRTRLGHLALDAAGRPSEITISRRHLRAHGWDEVSHTLLHEMVHLWQCANGAAVDHGPAFRRKAREVGVTAAARRWVTRRERPKDAAPTS
jgi:hypothetical protein